MKSYLLDAVVGKEVDLVLEELHVDTFHKGDLVDAKEHAHEDELAEVGHSHYRQVGATFNGLRVGTYRLGQALDLGPERLAREALS